LKINNKYSMAHAVLIHEEMMIETPCATELMINLN